MEEVRRLGSSILLTSPPSLSGGNCGDWQKCQRQQLSGCNEDALLLRFLQGGPLVPHRPPGWQDALLSKFAAAHRTQKNQGTHHPIRLHFSQQQQCSYFSTQVDEKSATSASKAPPPGGGTGSGKSIPSPRLGTTKIPTPVGSAPPDPSALEKLRKATPKSLVHKGMDLTISLFKSLVGFVLRLPGNIFFYVTHPDDLKQAFADMKQKAKDEVHHYWVGFKVRSFVAFLPSFLF